jgi:Family of unknown function (DUF6312)
MQTKTVVVNDNKKYPVRSVTTMHTEDDGTVVRTVLSKKNKKKRVSKRWRGMEKALRRVNKAQQTAASDYLRRHERSNKKKKNGAIRDLGKNLMRSQRKGRKKLKIRFL